MIVANIAAANLIRMSCLSNQFTENFARSLCEAKVALLSTYHSLMTDNVTTLKAPIGNDGTLQEDSGLSGVGGAS